MSEQLLPMNPLGRTGLTVSCLGLGTVKIGRNEGVKYPTGFALPDDQQVRDILALARELGINLIDTAPAYGNSEERLGKLLTNRHDWVICSKVGEEFADGKSFFDFSGKHVRRSIERSLKRLRTDYIDTVLVHSDGNDEAIIRSTDCFEVLSRCKEEGMIRSFGMSTKTVAGGRLALQESDVLMVTYNPGATADAEVIDLAHSQGKGILIKKALNSGHAVADAAATVDPVQASMNFIFARAGVSAIIVGTINPVHLRENARAAIAACS
ncbi:MAG: aldo/keto reductase [Pseudohongiellaceae bacterium]